MGFLCFVICGRDPASLPAPPPGGQSPDLHPHPAQPSGSSVGCEGDHLESKGWGRSCEMWAQQPPMGLCPLLSEETAPPLQACGRGPEGPSVTEPHSLEASARLPQCTSLHLPGAVLCGHCGGAGATLRTHAGHPVAISCPHSGLATPMPWALMKSREGGCDRHSQVTNTLLWSMWSTQTSKGSSMVKPREPPPAC